MCISFPALGCRRWQHAGVCQKKLTHEKLNVTRLFSFLPGCLRCLLLCTPASSYLGVAGSSGYNILFFFSTLLLICFSVSPSLLWVSVFFLASHTCTTKTTKQQEREEEVSTFSAHPPKTAVVLKEAYKQRVFACQSVPEGMWASPTCRLMCTQLDEISSGHWFSLPPLILLSQAPCLRWLATPTGAINLRFPFHNQSRLAKTEELHNVKLSETSCKVSFWMLHLKRSGYQSLRSWDSCLWLPLLGTFDLPGLKPRNPEAV